MKPIWRLVAKLLKIENERLNNFKSEFDHVNEILVSATQLEQSILTKKNQNCAQSKLQIN